MEDKDLIGLYMAFGVALGAGIGSWTDNLATWIPLGLALGAGLGYTIQQNKSKKDSNQ